MSARAKAKTAKQTKAKTEEAQSVCVVGSGWRFTSGISYYTCRLAGSLATQHRTSVVLMRRLIPRRLYPGAARVGKAGFALDYPDDVRVYDGVDWFWIPSLFGAVRFLRAQRPDVVVFQWWTGAVLHTYAVLAFVARRLGARVVVEFHETQDTGEARLPGVARYVDLLGRRFLRRASGYAVHSEFDRAAVSRSFALEDRPIAVIPHGPFDHHAVDDALAEPPRDHRLVVLFFGTIRPYKGLEYLIEAFDGLADTEAAEFTLLVVGETWEGWTKPIDLIAASRHRDRIELVNHYVAEAEIGGFFERADAVALPYTRSSASGPLHIAMAHGLPVVLSDVGGLRDGAADYEGVLWVPARDVGALRAALRELPALRGVTYDDARSWTHTAEAYRALFDRLATGNRA